MISLCIDLMFGFVSWLLYKVKQSPLRGCWWCVVSGKTYDIIFLIATHTIHDTIVILSAIFWAVCLTSKEWKLVICFCNIQSSSTQYTTTLRPCTFILNIRRECNIESTFPNLLQQSLPPPIIICYDVTPSCCSRNNLIRQIKYPNKFLIYWMFSYAYRQVNTNHDNEGIPTYLRV